MYRHTANITLYSMPYQLNKTQTNEIEINVTISAQDLKTESSWAAARLSKDLKIPGFRPGKAPYDIVKKEIGEDKILQEAADKIVTDKINEIIKKENLQIAGQPKIEIKKLASGNELIFKATMPLLPEVTLPDFSKITVETPKASADLSADEAGEAGLEEALKNLQQMQKKEVLERRPAQKGDKVEVDFEIQIDNKTIEGGKAEKHGFILGERQMLPEFEGPIIGMKENEEKEYEMQFPKEYAEQLAGKNAKAKVKVRGVFKLEPPELNDDLAKKVGAKSLDDLKKKITENLQKEAEMKTKEKQEIKMVEKATEATKITAIPETLIKNEQTRILAELEAQIAQSGGKFDDYLKHAKKTREELEASFKDNAQKRVKTQLLFRKIIIDNKLEPKKELVDAEIEKATAMYASMPEMAEKIKTDNYRNYVESMVLNRQVIEWLKGKVR